MYSEHLDLIISERMPNYELRAALQFSSPGIEMWGYACCAENVAIPGVVAIGDAEDAGDSRWRYRLTLVVPGFHDRLVACARKAFPGCEVLS